MAREIPEVVRAVAGLAATVLDEARKLPETLPGLPVRLIGQALQTSLKLQQHYSGLVARGDELFTGLRGEDEPGLATFDDDLPPAPRTTGPRSSAFDRVDDLPSDTVAEELADEFADDLAVADLPPADPDLLSEEAAAVLLISPDEDTGDLAPAVVAGLPDDPIADAVTAVVDELAAEVADEVAAELPDAVPDEVLEDLTADTVAEVAEEEEAVEEAVAEGLIAEAAVGGTPPAEDAPPVPSLADVAPDEAPEQTQLVDDGVPDVAALEVAAEEIVELGGPEAAQSATPASAPDDGPAGGTDVSGAQAAGTSPVEGYDSFSIPALRGRLRSYPAETVADLLDYERATRARAPYVTLLQNRLEKLSADRG
jgi:hypothetical protein